MLLLGMTNEAKRVAGWMGTDEASSLFEAARDGLHWEQRSVSIFGRKIAQPRLVAYLASNSYTYSGMTLAPALAPAWLDAVISAVSVAAGTKFNSVLLNRYRDGQDGISWHSDDEKELGADPVVASISLGSSRRFLTKCRETKAVESFQLAHGDLMVMPAGFQRTHTHSIPKAARVAGERISLTFRAVSK